MIAPDQIFTIEPGIYFVDMLLRPLRDSAQGKLVNWTNVDALAPFGGIRIEDDVRVQSNAPVENYTRRHL